MTKLANRIVPSGDTADWARAVVITLAHHETRQYHHTHAISQEIHSKLRSQPLHSGMLLACTTAPRSGGPGTAPHCDLVYMGRGTKNVFTMWVPYGEVPLELGGLMVLEQSHLKNALLKN